MRFWTRIFAVSFAMGVVSGIVMSYEFGTNWSRFSVAVGNVVGPLIGYEVLSAFFLEATFLGVLLFGFNKVPPWLYVLSGAIVALGTAMSAFWILSANSWMQTPAGFELKDGIAYPTDWLAAIFNPSFPYRFAHMLNAAYLTTGFVVLAVGARYLLAGRHIEEGRTMLRMAIGLTAILAPLQLVIGDQHGLNTLQHQPIKVAAMEAHWDGDKPGDFEIFAWPDEKAETNRYAISIPNGASLILTHKINGLFPGLKSVPANERPPVKVVFFAFRIMLGFGFFMIGAALFGAFLWWRGTLFETRWYLAIMAQCWWVGFVAVIAGWVVTESGRQPWIVEGILRTADANSPVPAEHRRDAGAVRARLRRRVLVRHLLHQPADRQRIGKSGGEGDREVLRQSDLRSARGLAMEWYLPVIWAGLIGTAVAMYVILDGFDLGIGILFPFARSESERDQMMRTVAPFWDGNETWLVLGGGGLWVAFPSAYAVIMPALYLPVIVMLLALVFRGVAFEFRTVSRSKTWLNVAFTDRLDARRLRARRHPRRADPGHSGRKRRLCRRRARLGDALRLPLRLGADRRLRLARRHLAGDEDRRPGGASARAARPRNCCCWCCSSWRRSACGRRCRSRASRSAGSRCRTFYFLWPVPVVTALAAFAIWRGIEKGREVPPFLAAIVLFLLGYLGLVISNFPYLVPPVIAVWDTAAAPASQIFMLLGTLVLLPMILGYIAFVYWLFRGKVKEGESYH